LRAYVAIAVLAVAPCITAAAQTPDSLPAGVTPLMVRNGQLLYEGPGLCTSCHGPTGRGVAHAGADLTDSVWIHVDGSFESILRVIAGGVLKAHSSTGAPMPERGASRLTENQLRAIAAYVWTFRRPAASPAAAGGRGAFDHR
jgi:mono/diheme cytochrome c family protein